MFSSPPYPPRPVNVSNYLYICFIHIFRLWVATGTTDVAFAKQKASSATNVKIVTKTRSILGILRMVPAFISWNQTFITHLISQGMTKNFCCEYDFETCNLFSCCTNFCFCNFFVSRAEDIYHTQINFRNMPQKPRKDVEFTLNCSQECKFNITFMWVSIVRQWPTSFSFIVSL